MTLFCEGWFIQTLSEKSIAIQNMRAQLGWAATAGKALNELVYLKKIESTFR